MAFRLVLASPAIGIPDPNIAAEALLLGLVALAVVLDARRRREDLFLGNLGIPAGVIALAALPLAMVAELLIP
jgi:hypothetical protein